MDKLKLVKTIVFVITFLLVFGSMTLLGTLYKKIRKPVATEPGSSISLKQPTGSTIDSFRLHGGSIYLLVKDGGRPDRILIYNQDAGEPVEINVN